METIAFNHIPEEYQEDINHIHNEDLLNIYNSFEFSYLNLSQYPDNIKNDKSLITKLIHDFLSEYKFMAYTIFDENFSFAIKIKYRNLFNKRKAVVICAEKRCFIINEISTELINQVFKSLKSSLINVDEEGVTDPRTSKVKYNEAKEESKSFCSNFIFEEKQKDFVRITLSTIGCFLIRRFFYPSSYFKDPSFFKFDKCPENYEEYVKRKIKKMLLAQNEEEMKSTIEKVPDNEVHLNKIYEFEEKEFFLLRELGGGDAKNFQL